MKRFLKVWDTFHFLPCNYSECVHFWMPFTEAAALLKCCSHHTSRVDTVFNRDTLIPSSCRLASSKPNSGSDSRTLRERQGKNITHSTMLGFTARCSLVYKSVASAVKKAVITRSHSEQYHQQDAFELAKADHLAVTGRNEINLWKSHWLHSYGLFGSMAGSTYFNRFVILFIFGPCRQTQGISS